MRACLTAIIFLLGLGVVAARPYESDFIRRKLQKLNLERAVKPQGKIIGRIIIEREDVFSRASFFPLWFNVFHWMTKKRVIKRELLFKAGEPYNKALVEESGRNLRKMPIFSVVRIIPVRAQRDGLVDMLVLTKDLWSLRLNTEFQLTGDHLDYLHLSLTEQNFLGLGKWLSINFSLKPYTYSLGQTYHDPRLGGTRLTLTETLNVIQNRTTNHFEGLYGYLQFSRPISFLSDKWGFSVGSEFEWGVTRRLSSGMIRLYNAPSTPEEDKIPVIYDRRLLSAWIDGRRSLGHKIKHQIEWGYGVVHRHYELPRNFTATGTVREEFIRDELPGSETSTFVYGTYHSFRPVYRKLRNIETYALTEDYLIGHDINFQVRWANRVFFSPLTYLEFRLTALYRWLWARENLLEFNLSARCRIQDNVFVNNRLYISLKNASPVLWIGRFVFRAAMTLRHRDLFKLFETLGGDNALRGYPSQAFWGRNALLFNLEYRSLPLNLKTVHLGFVLFYDMGSVFDKFSELNMKYSLGVGVRILFPQVNRLTLRIDFGIPLTAPFPSTGERFSISFSQAF